MRGLSRIVLGALVLAGGASTAFAESSLGPGPYLGGYGAFVIPQGIDIEGDADGDGIDDKAKVEFDNGWGVGSLLGYDYGAIRVEADIGYRSFDATDIKNLRLGDGAGGYTNAGDSTVDNNFGVLSVMGNVLYEYENSSVFTPYVGAGLGAAWVFVNEGSGAVTIASGDDVGFAYQGIVGAKVSINDNLSAFADYRYLGTSDIQVNELKSSYALQSVQAGLVYAFSAYDPPPPPVPSPDAAPVSAPVLDRSYMVFFDWNSAEISADAAAIIQDAAQSALTRGVSRIELTGHADRSGSPAYNQALSLRRAEAVKAHLLEIGMTTAEIVTLGKGESAPLVPTPDGVREPQNRRVEIVLP